ncbi:MAG: hypothetical protein JNK15_17500 [Planctomycetes bacterium]|nr:hypothetical protein [Planctomycetota bacterium]
MRRQGDFRMRNLAATTFTLLLAACATRAPIADRADDPRLLADVRQAVAALGPGVRAAVWLGRPGETPQLAWNVETPLPCASAIKAAYLVELFADRASALDAPLPGAAATLADAQHPAVAHFTAAQRTTAAQALATASTRRIAEAMITGKGVDNVTYNIAANLVTAHLGGPVGLDAKLHARDPDWHGLHVRRYMLASRTMNGDNECSARSLAAVHAALAAHDLAGVAPAAIDAARAVLRIADAGDGRARFYKGGALDSDPVTRVDAGWREGPDGARVHVVMLAQDGVAPAGRGVAGEHLGDAARRIVDMLHAPRR